MSRDWKKDMERVQLGRKMYKTYGAVVEGMDPKESLDEVLIYRLQHEESKLTESKDKHHAVYDLTENNVHSDED